MSEQDGTADEPDWRRSETYDYTRPLPRRGWAWEFLRRNPDYRREWVPLPDKATTETIRPALTVLTLRATGQGRPRWGLLFRQFTESQCDCVLASGVLPVCAPRYGRFRRLLEQRGYVPPVGDPLPGDSAAHRCPPPASPIAAGRKQSPTGRFRSERARGGPLADRRHCRSQEPPRPPDGARVS